MAPSQAPITRRAFRSFIFVIGIVFLCLLAVQPFLHGRMPRTDDGLLQMYRGVALDHSLRVDNPLWPRYSSGLAYGYGAPLFNYFPPLSYFPATWLHGIGFSFVGAWLLSMVIYTLLAALGIFLLARLWTGSDLAGWMAALAYVHAPFLLFDSLTRGSSPELAALAALPFVMLGFTRLAWYAKRTDFALAVASFALFVPLHTLITLHGTAILALYCLFLVWRSGEARGLFLRLSLAGLLSLAITSFYWLPALLEADAIKLSLISEQLGHIDVRRHLRPLAAILALPHSADPTQQNQAIPISLGWPQLILSAIGLLLSLRPALRRYLPLMLLIWILTLVLAFMNTTVSASLWETIPLIRFTQFPWRLLGLASLLLALGSGLAAYMIASILSPGKSLPIVIALLGVIILLYALPWTYRSYHDDLGVDDIRAVHRFERDGGQLALSSYAEYLPVSADAGYLDPQRLTERFSTGDVIRRLSPSAEFEILSEQWDGTSARLRLLSAEAQTLVFDWIYVPGWRADIDGKALAVFPSAPAGLVALDLPAGEFDLRIALGATSIQIAAGVLSALGVIAFAALTVFWRFAPSASGMDDQATGPDLRLLAAFAALGLGMFLFKTLVLDTIESPIKSNRFGNTVDAPALANFANRIDLLAADLPSGTIDRRRFEVVLFWRPHGETLDRDYSSIARLRDPWGAVIAEGGSFAPGGLATSNWLENTYVKDVITVDIPPYTPPLESGYQLEVSLFDALTQETLSVINAAGNPHDVKYPLASLRYSPSEGQDAAAELPIIGAAAGPAVLVGAPELPPAASVGDELRFGWTWRKAGAGAADLTARLVWLDEDGQAAGLSRALPLVRGYDIAQWRIGEVFHGHHRVTVPPDLPPGQYALGLQMLDAGRNPLGEVITLDASMKVTVPQRQFVAPEYAIARDTVWDNGIILHGYRTRETGELSLVWGTSRLLSDSLRLFVHVLDEQDLILAQWDGVPADWSRPTTSWLPAEYVTTRHRFDLPAGEYRIRVGWYDPATGERVRIGDDDAMALDMGFQSR